MKNLVFASVCLVASVAFVACAGSGVTPDASAARLRAVLADGVVTQAEVAEVQAVADDLEGGSGFDWMAALGVAGTIAGSILGIRVLPNRAILGQAAASKLS